MKPFHKFPAKKESGQILVILGLAMVAIVAFAGLAIDGNRVYQARRTNQSTADSAALAGAGAAAQYLKNSQYAIFACASPGNMLSADASDRGRDAAIASAAKDGITLAAYIPNPSNPGNLYSSTCASDGKRKYLDITVKVTTNTPLSLARVVNWNSMSTSATATVRVYPVQSAAYGNALASLSTTCGPDGGIEFGGTSIVDIKQGGVFSNSCINPNGGPTVTVEHGAIQYYHTFPYTPSGSITPPPIPTADRLSDDLISPPQCSSDTPYVDVPAQSVTLTPGNYNGISVKSNGVLTLQPGLYCLKGDLTANANATLIANGVTIYFLNGSTSFNGSAILTLVAPPGCPSKNCPADGIPPAIPGLLMYVDKANPTTITLNGTSLNNYQGTIYAPTSLVKVNGTADAKTMYTQIISKQVTITGKANLLMDQTSDDQFKYESSLELLK